MNVAQINVDARVDIKTKSVFIVNNLKNNKKSQIKAELIIFQNKNQITRKPSIRIIIFKKKMKVNNN